MRGEGGGKVYRLCGYIWSKEYREWKGNDRERIPVSDELFCLLSGIHFSVKKKVRGGYFCVQQCHWCHGVQICKQFAPTELCSPTLIPLLRTAFKHLDQQNTHPSPQQQRQPSSRLPQCLAILATFATVATPSLPPPPTTQAPPSQCGTSITATPNAAQVANSPATTFSPLSVPLALSPVSFSPPQPRNPSPPPTVPSSPTRVSASSTARGHVCKKSPFRDYVWAARDCYPF